MRVTFAFVLVAIVHTVKAAETQVVFKRVNTFNWIYNDAGTSANVDVSIWRPYTLEHGYFAVGDVAVASHSPPGEVAIMVKEITAGSLAKPVRFIEMWNDRGSGGDHDVRVMRMFAPRGYTCLGDVAVLGYDKLPDANLYRCVKTAYVTTGVYEYIWNDRGSGYRVKAVTFWANRVHESHTHALNANAFTSYDTYVSPVGKRTPWMLNGNYVKSHLTVSSPLGSYVFTVYQVDELDEIWSDRGGNAYADFSSWRSRGRSDTYSLGDIGVGYHRKPPHGYVVKAHKDGALAAPYDWRPVWDDRGSNSYWDVTFFKPLCGAGYRALGHVSMRSRTQKPSKDQFRCVKTEYTTGGQFVKVWDDRGGDAYRDVTVYKAVSPNYRYGQGVEAMSTIARRGGGMDVGAYVLKSDIVNFVQGKPAKRYILTNVQYNFDDRQLVGSEPESLTRVIVENRGDTVQQASEEEGYTYEESYSWGNSVGLDIGIEIEATAGVPLFGESTVKTTVTASYSHEWGGSKTVTKEEKIIVSPKVKPYSSKACVVSGQRYVANVPYTGTLTTEYYDGSRSTRYQFSGIYRGVQINEVRVIYEADVPLPE